MISKRRREKEKRDVIKKGKGEKTERREVEEERKGEGEKSVLKKEISKE